MPSLSQNQAPSYRLHKQSGQAVVNHEHYATNEQARASIFEYIEVFYNRKRRHGSLGYVSSETFEVNLD